MRNFISLQKRKGLFVAPATETFNNANLVHQLNHELMKYGYLLSKEVFDKLAGQSTEYINGVYNELLTEIRKVVGGGGYEPIYKNFPQSVMAMSYTKYLLDAILHYWSFGAFLPSDGEIIEREFAIEVVNYKTITDLTENEITSIFTDLLYSGNSISKFDKVVIDYFIDNQYKFDFSKITFKETSAYVGKRLLNYDSEIEILPTKDATNILRIWAAYSGGDEGLKENTRFKNPSSKQRKVMLNTLEQCYNIEESFKIYREKWLKMLFHLNPLMSDRKKNYPIVADYTDKIRNTPKVLKTFNSKIEEGLKNKDVAVLDLLKTRGGVFMRRLDHAVRVFGLVAITKWLESTPKTNALLVAYNQFTDRDKKQDGRGAILASASKSELVSYDALEPLDSALVSVIKELIIGRLRNIKVSDFSNKKVYIDRSLYYRPLALNNRAASMSLDGKVNGTVERLPEGKVIRLYTHWYGRTDIDLSCLVLTKDGEFQKIGWNGSHRNESIVYSGDNTGDFAQNAEYHDITLDNCDENTEWIISEARIYEGRGEDGYTYSSFKTPARTGWMLRDFPEQNTHWLPETVAHSVVLEASTRVAFVMALHVPTRSVVYLDLAMGDDRVSDDSDALKIKMFLDNFITLDDGSTEVKWDKINQGHVINLMSQNLVDKPEDADLVFGENTTWENISKYI